MSRQTRPDPNPLKLLEERAIFLDRTLNSLQRDTGVVAPIREKLAVMWDSLRRVQAIQGRLSREPNAPFEALLAYEWQNMDNRCQDLNRTIREVVPTLLEAMPAPTRS